MAKKKFGVKAIIETVIIALPLAVGIIFGNVYGDEALYSQKGIVISTLFDAFLVLCWTGITVYEFFCTFRSVEGKTKKAISVAFLVLLLIVSGFKIYLRYDYTSLGKQAADALRIAEEATEAGTPNAWDLHQNAFDLWERVNSRKIIAGLVNILYILLVFRTPWSASKAKPEDCNDANQTDSV